MLSPVNAPLSLKKKVLIGSLIGFVGVVTIVGVIVSLQGSSTVESSKFSNADISIVEYGSEISNYCFVMNGMLYIPIPTYIGCVIRTDTFERVYPSSDGYVQVPASFVSSIELYSSSRFGDCIDLVSELSC
jgi:hypothetical protein